MKIPTNKPLARFTDHECVLLAALAVDYFKRIEAMKEKNKNQPPLSPKGKKLSEDIQYIYQILLDNANSVFDIKEEYALPLGLVVGSIVEYKDLENEAEEESILIKMNDFLFRSPSYNKFIEVTRAMNNKS